MGTVGYLAASFGDGEAAGELRRRDLLDLEAHRVQHVVQLRRLAGVGVAVGGRRRLMITHASALLGLLGWWL